MCYSICNFPKHVATALSSLQGSFQLLCPEANTATHFHSSIKVNVRMSMVKQAHGIRLLCHTASRCEYSRPCLCSADALSTLLLSYCKCGIHLQLLHQCSSDAQQAAREADMQAVSGSASNAVTTAAEAGSIRGGDASNAESSSSQRIGDHACQVILCDKQ